MESEKFTLFCLVQGDRLSRAFPVEVGLAENVGALIQKIREKRPLLKSLDLRLWKVEIPLMYDTDRGVPDDLKLGDDGGLCPSLSIWEIWPQGQDDYMLNIFLKPFPVPLRPKKSKLSYQDQATMDQVIPGLWIGNYASSADFEWLRENNIGAILTVLSDIEYYNGPPRSSSDPVRRHRITLDDKSDENILSRFPESISFIQTQLDKETGVLVHCYAGVSRSATIVAAYLMYTRNLDSKAAISLIVASRPIVHPNRGFRSQLADFHRTEFAIMSRVGGKGQEEEQMGI